MERTGRKSGKISGMQKSMRRYTLLGRLISGAMTQFKGGTISHCHPGGERVVSQLYLKNPSLTNKIRLDFAHYVTASENEPVKGPGNQESKNIVA